MKIKLLETEEEYGQCLKIAKELREWFNEAGLKAMEKDLVINEKTFVVVDNEVKGFITLKPVSDKTLEIIWFVKTSASEDYEPYAKTRKFYEAKGFIKVALVDPYPSWQESAVIYVKCLQ